MKETQIWAKHFLHPDDRVNFRLLTRKRVKNDARPRARQKK